jgi:hypothetical protein
LLDIAVPQVRNQLARASGTFVIGLREGVASADFEWMVAFYSGFDRDHQQPTAIDSSATTFNSAAVQGVGTQRGEAGKYVFQSFDDATIQRDTSSC